MGSKARLSSYCNKRANNGVNLVTSRKINTRLARPMADIVYILRKRKFITVMFSLLSHIAYLTLRLIHC